MDYCITATFFFLIHSIRLTKHCLQFRNIREIAALHLGLHEWQSYDYVFTKNVGWLRFENVDDCFVIKLKLSEWKTNSPISNAKRDKWIFNRK